MCWPNSVVAFEITASLDNKVYTLDRPYSCLSCPFLVEKVKVDFGLMIGINNIFVIIVFLHLTEPSTSGISVVVREVTPAVSLVASLYSLFVNPGMPSLTNFSIVEYHLSVSGSPK